MFAKRYKGVDEMVMMMLMKVLMMVLMMPLPEGVEPPGGDSGNGSPLRSPPAAAC